MNAVHEVFEREWLRAIISEVLHRMWEDW